MFLSREMPGGSFYGDRRTSDFSFSVCDDLAAVLVRFFKLTPRIRADAVSRPFGDDDIVNVDDKWIYDVDSRHDGRFFTIM